MLRNFEFSNLSQLPAETFSALPNRMEREGNTCTFCKCDRAPGAGGGVCNASEMAIRDQIVIVIVTHNESWKKLTELRTEGMKLESASCGEEKMYVQKPGQQGFQRLTVHQRAYEKLSKAKCSSCKKVGHYGAGCNSPNNSKDLRVTSATNSDDSATEESEDIVTFALNLLRIKTSHSTPRYVSVKREKQGGG